MKFKTFPPYTSSCDKMFESLLNLYKKKNFYLHNTVTKFKSSGYSFEEFGSRKAGNDCFCSKVHKDGIETRI